MRLIIFILTFFLIGNLFAKQQRIVSLAPSITEMVYAAGAGKDLVGVSSNSDFPSAAKKLPVVATNASIDFERLAELKPTVVFAWKGGNAPSEVASLKQEKIKVIWLNVSNPNDIVQALIKIGQVAGTKKVALNFARHWYARYEFIKREYQNRSKVSVFYQVSFNPLITLNHASWVTQMIQDCGGKNIFASAMTIAPVVSLSSLLSKQPEAIIITNPGKTFAQLAKPWYRWPQLQAVKKGNLFTIPSSLIDRPGPRLLQGMTMLCKDLNKVRKGRRNS